MNKLRICFGLLTAFLFGTLVVQAESGGPERPLAERNPSLLWGTAAVHGSLPTQAPQITVTAPALPGSKDTPKASESSDSKYKTPGQEMKKNPDLRKNILTAQTNALEEDVAKAKEEFDKKAKEGIVIDTVSIIWGGTTYNKGIKYKQTKGGKYYFSTGEASGDPNDGYREVKGWQMARRAAQKVLEDIRSEKVQGRPKGDITITQVTKAGDTIVVVYCVQYQDNKVDRRVYYSTTVDLAKYRETYDPGTDSLFVTRLTVSLKQMAKKGYEAVSKGKTLKAKGNMDSLEKAFEENLGIPYQVKQVGTANPKITAELTWHWVHKDIVYNIVSYVTDLTAEEYSELLQWSEKGYKTLQKTGERVAIFAGLCEENGGLVDVEEDPKQENTYRLICAQDYEEKINQASLAEIAELKALAKRNREDKPFSCKTRTKGIEKWSENYNQLLNDVYMEEKFAKKLGIVFGGEHVLNVQQSEQQGEPLDCK